MVMSLNKKKLLHFVINQLNFLFKDNRKIKTSNLISSFNIALDRTEYCFSKIKGRYYKKNKEIYFNHLNSDQYSIFLYFLSNTCFKEKIDYQLSNKIYCLNKILHSVDIFYEIKLPDIFNLVHPLGTVLGRAKYSNFFTHSFKLVYISFHGKVWRGLK